MESEPPEPLYLDDRPAGSFLTQARAALTACGNPKRLYSRAIDLRDSSSTRITLAAEGRQIDFARTSILFSALAAEGYVNAALSSATSGSEFDGLDKLRTVDKYLFGPQIALGRTLFARDTEPAQSIAMLFKRRDELVHAKPRRLEVDRSTLADPRYERFNPHAASRYLVAVAEAAGVLAEAGGEAPDTIVTSIRENRERVLTFGESLLERLPPPPTPDPESRPARRYVRAYPQPVASSVPRAPMDLLQYISSLPGTATAPYPPHQPSGGG